MPSDAITDLVTHGGRHEHNSEGIYVRFTGTTRPTQTLHERVQAAKDAYIEYETVNLGIPGGDPSRWRLKPFINECFAHMSNALTHIDHIRGSGDVVAAADEMDKYQFHLRLIRHNNATRFTEDETEAGFHPEPKDSSTGIKDAVQSSLRSLELEVKRGCLEYWGAQLSPQRVPRSGKIKDGTLEDGELEEEEQGWKSIEDFRHAVATVEHRVKEGIGRYGSCQSPEEEMRTLEEELNKLFKVPGNESTIGGNNTRQITWRSKEEEEGSHFTSS